jgi:dihydrofolate reductase
MRDVVYSMSMSVDGYVKDRDGDFGWSVPDEELHQFHNDRVRETGVQLLGRGLYETMTYWETADQDPEAGAIELDFAAIWKALPKIVFSNTLESVEGTNIRLATEPLADEIARLKEEPGKEIAIGGATLAAEATRLGLIDEYHVFVSPVAVGGGTPFFGALDGQVDLELVDNRTFGSRVVFLRYRRA